MSKNRYLSSQPKPLAKCIDRKSIYEWIPEPARRRVDLTAAWSIIKNHYCAALVGRGVCPVQCENCREALLDIFQLENATNPEALLTWRAKDGSASMIERLIEAQKHDFPAPETPSDPLASLYRKKPIGNLFLEMLEDYQ